MFTIFTLSFYCIDCNGFSIYLCYFRKLSKNTKWWNSLLIHLGSIMTNDVWLTDVKMNDKQVLSIRGMAASYPALAKTLKNCEKDTYFNNVNLVNSEAGKGEKDKMLTSFEIQASFKEL